VSSFLLNDGFLNAHPGFHRLELTNRFGGQRL
jgi:hypothetical protein